MLWGQATWIDLFFLPCLAILIARDILASGNRRNLVMPFILIALAALNLLLWLDLPALPAEVILPAAITLIAALVALIGGRIIPAFTQNGLRQQGITANCVTPRWLDRLVIPALLAAALLRLILPASIWEGGASGLVALLLAARLVGWHSFQTRKTPLLWNLHVGYSFLPLGFALTAIADFGGPITASAALHALTVGAMGVMIAAVASRAGLGHAGRPLIPSPLTIGAYVLLITAALVRVFWPEMTGFYLAGGLWIAGWGLLAVVYGPILTQKRIDGLPG